MRIFNPTRFLSSVTISVAIVSFTSSSAVVADTFISGFEGDLSSTLGRRLAYADALGTTFVTERCHGRNPGTLDHP